MTSNNRTPKDSVIIITITLIVFFLLKETIALLWIALISSLLCLMSKRLTWLIHLTVTKTTQVIGLIIQKVVLTTVFFLILTPLAYLYRFFGNNDDLKLKRNYNSTFSENKERIDKAYFKKMW